MCISREICVCVCCTHRLFVCALQRLSGMYVRGEKVDYISFATIAGTAYVPVSAACASVSGDGLYGCAYEIDDADEYTMDVRLTKVLTDASEAYAFQASNLQCPNNAESRIGSMIEGLSLGQCAQECLDQSDCTHFSYGVPQI